MTLTLSPSQLSTVTSSPTPVKTYNQEQHHKLTQGRQSHTQETLTLHTQQQQ
jgi:hypothetical protein